MIKKIQNSLIKKFLDFRYHLYHKITAYRILNKIERTYGKTEKRLINLSNQYAIDVLGNKKISPWFYVYSAVSQTFKGWMDP